MATIKSYTDLEQSKKLAEILPLDSADMNYWCGTQIRIGGHRTMDKDLDVPCWSLAALLIVVSEVSLNSFKDGNWNAMVQQNGKMIYGDANNSVDACYEMILKLHELKML